MYEVNIADRGKYITTIKCGIHDFVRIIRVVDEVVKYGNDGVLAYKDDKAFYIKECKND